MYINSSARANFKGADICIISIDMSGRGGNTHNFQEMNTQTQDALYNCYDVHTRGTCIPVSRFHTGGGGGWDPPPPPEF